VARSTLAALCWVVVAVSGACSTSPQNATSGPAPPSSSTAITTTTVVPRPIATQRVCTEESVRGVVEALLGAYNAGESNLSERFFGGSFLWYWDEGRVGAEGMSQATLNAYFAMCHSMGDQLVVQKFDFYGESNNEGAVETTLLRRDNTSPEPRVFGFKAGIDCPSHRIKLWSMGEKPA
jgi:hypothetical protein